MRAYTFLSQIFDYGNTALEKRSIFYRLLVPLLDFEREREGVDLSKLVLTHHQLRSHGAHPMPLGEGAAPFLEPLEGLGSGVLREKQKAFLSEIIARVNDLFEGELTDDDKLVYVTGVIMGKMLESTVLQQQALHNTKDQFGASPALRAEHLDAIIDSHDAHQTMSRQALNSERLREDMLQILLNHAGLWEALRERASGSTDPA